MIGHSQYYPGSPYLKGRPDHPHIWFEGGMWKCSGGPAWAGCAYLDRSPSLAYQGYARYFPMHVDTAKKQR